MIHRQVISFALTVALVIAACFEVSAFQQNETRAKAAEAVDLMLKDRSLALSQLRALGEPAIPYVVEILQPENKPLVPVRLTLLTFISETKGRESDEALIKLLSLTARPLCENNQITAS